MPDSLATLHAVWRIVRNKPRQIWRLVLPPFLLAMGVKAWLSVQVTGHVWPDLPDHALALRGTLALAVAVMALLWHRATYFGPRAPLSARLALGYWGQGAVLCLLAMLPFVPIMAMTTGPDIHTALRQGAVFLADGLSLWLVVIFGIVVARRAGGTFFGWRKAWRTAPVATGAALAFGLALMLQIQDALVAALTLTHSGAAFLLDSAISFAVIVAVLTLMTRPKLA